MGPLLTLKERNQLIEAARAGAATVECSLDLGRTVVSVGIDSGDWQWEGRRYPYLDQCKERTIYYWDGAAFAPVTRYTDALIKLVPTEWGAPTFEIDGIKMLPTARLSPYEDAERKVAWIEPRGKVILDTCGGLGYFAACCVRSGAERVLSFEKNPEVLWLRTLNPWSPVADEALRLEHGDILERITALADAAFDAILHDPPRFGIAGDLYSQRFYDQLARVIKRNGRLFHYTGSPNRLTTGRDVPQEVAKRLRKAGFTTDLHGDGIRALKT
ncbi:MAG: SAM-dependent methyltransferase [Gammaproteobacteria bacterium]|nr:SAM-dependent methyltransferase [Gammaproteobacteria bacterium]